MYIVCLNGLKRSGKDYAADILMDFFKRYGVHSERTSFAKELRFVCQTIFGATAEQLQEKKDEVSTFYFNDALFDARIKMSGIPFGSGIQLMSAIHEQMMLDELFIPYEFDSLACRSYMQMTGRQLLRLVGNAVREVEPDYWVKQVVRESELNGGNNSVLLVTDCRMLNEAKIADMVVNIQNPTVTSDGHSTEQPLPFTAINQCLVNNMDAAYKIRVQHLGELIIRNVNKKMRG
ncbi:dNMP kinase [Aeromonas phage MJG]|uniref:DNMP kinase n=1 Tax=Aeromonas phage MJG TaxID=2510451 RepID=A0A5J6A1J4_9CAUD|nr:dNMP kinase [Aeromonas phage MJG]